MYQSKVTFSLAGIQRPGHRVDNCKMVYLQYIHVAFMNFREQIQFTLKKLEHCTATNVHIPNERAIQAVWLHIQLYNLGILVQFPKGNQTLSG